MVVLGSRTSGVQRGLVRLLAVAFLAAPLGACGSMTENFSMASLNPFAKRTAVVADEPAEKLYNEGVYLLNEKRDFREAGKRFDEVDRQHPYSEWARKSLLMSAYASYEAREYDETVSSAKRYIALHPGTPDAAYAQFLIGSANYDRIPTVSRDQAITEKALAELEEVYRKFPNTEYAASARKKIEVARDNLAGREMEVGRFYMNKRNYTGAINRFKVVVTQYQTTRHVEEALMRLTEAYMSLGITGEAQTAAAVLGHNFPESPWYKDAYALVKTGGLEPREASGSWISRAFKRVGLG